MKVGTDGALLGAWAPAYNPKNILDAGTGTGLIALMLAQRFPHASIAAIEPNREAVLDAADNFARNPIGKRISLIETTLQDFRTETRFDLIVSNPPFFRNALPAPEPGRRMARHNDTFGHRDLLNAAELLTPKGILAGIYPTDIWPHVQKDALARGMVTTVEQPVKSHPEKPAHRILFAFSKVPLKELFPIIPNFSVETGVRHQYSTEFTRLLKPFYLKL